MPEPIPGLIDADDLRAIAARAVLLWLATVDPEGAPNVSPKEVWSLTDDHRLLIAEILSPASLRNLRADGRACASFLDIHRQRGYRFWGRVQITPRGAPGFDAMAAGLIARAGPRFPVRAVLDLRPDRIAALRAPSYVLYPETRETDQIAAAHALYGTQPA